MCIILTYIQWRKQDFEIGGVKIYLHTETHPRTRTLTHIHIKEDPYIYTYTLFICSSFLACKQRNNF